MRRQSTLITVTLLTAVAAVFTGCEQQEFRMPPYIAKKDCTFELVIGSDRKASKTVARGSGNATDIEVGKYRIGVSDCQVIDNPNGLPIYQD